MKSQRPKRQQRPAKGKGTPGGRPTKDEARAKARLLSRVFGELGDPPDDAIQAQKWAARAQRLAARAYFGGKIGFTVFQEAKAVVKAVLATVGPEQLADLDAAIKQAKRKAAAPRPVKLRPVTPIREGDAEDAALRGVPPRAAKPE